MTSVTATAANINREMVKGWMLGLACGVLLTITAAVGLEQLRGDSGTETSNAAVQPVATGLVPPPINEEQIYRPQVAPVVAEGLVPPVIGEEATYRWPAALIEASSGLVPPPVDEFQRYYRGQADGVLPALDQSQPLADK